MKRIYSVKLVAILWLALLFSSFESKAQLVPPNPNLLLNTWSFEDASWFSDAGYAPVSFTNLNNPPSFDGSGLLVDSTNAAWLNYNFIEASNSITNLTFNAGTIEMWVLPNWNSGTGPGDWGRLIEVGDYSTNNPSSWWSLYFNQDGSSLFFSSETNGVFTNYLAYPISWDNTTWHFLALTYNHFRSQLYVDGQLAVSGEAVRYLPPTNVTSFFVGSDNTGLAQSRVLIDDMATYNYAISPYAVSNDYAAGIYLMSGGFHRDDDGGLTPPGGGGTGTNDYTGGSNYVPPDYGSNLWLATLSLSNNVAGLLLSNTTPDILFELQGRTNLAAGDWFSLGFVNGSELTNATPASVYANPTGNLFLRIRSWQDTTGTGIPDWWWLTYFGQTTNVDAYASATGDGLSNLQKFQQGINPTNYYHPAALDGFFGSVAATNAFLYWNPATNATGYLIRRGILNTNGTYTYTQMVVSSNATWFEDVGVVTNANAQNNIYNLQAMFPGGVLSGTNTWQVSWYANYASYGTPYVPPAPSNVYAHADSTGTNVVISWTPVTASVNQATNYLVQLGTPTAYAHDYTFTPIALAGSNITAYTFAGLTNDSGWTLAYAVTAVYPGGGRSSTSSSYNGSISPVGLGNKAGTAAPTHFVGYSDFGTNLFLAWDAVPGAVAYLLYGSDWDNDLGLDRYQSVGRATGTAFELPGGIDNEANAIHSSFYVVAVYADGSLSQSATCVPVTKRLLPAPTGLTAYVDATGTNIILHWDSVPGAIGYRIDRDDVGEIATTGAQPTYYFDTNAVNVLNAEWAEYGLDYTIDSYGVTALLPYGIETDSAGTWINAGPPAPAAPGNFTATVDATGTNIVLTWDSAGWAATGYTIWRGSYNAANGTYSYTQIGTAGAGATSFTDSGVVVGSAAANATYQLIAEGANSQFSMPVTASPGLTSPSVGNNLSVAAQMVRNETGHWQLMFASLPPNVSQISLAWGSYDYFYDFGPEPIPLQVDNGQVIGVEDKIPVASITNGIYVITDSMMTNWLPDNAVGKIALVRPIDTNGVYGRSTVAGFQPYDSPVFVDGREHLKQNLLFELRAATISQRAISLTENNVYNDPFYLNLGIPTDTNYVESSFFHWSKMFKGFNNAIPIYTKMDDLWPFTVNYQLHQMLFDANYTGPSAFVWQTNLVTIPAPAVLDVSDPYWIYQGLGNLADVAAYTNSGNLYLQSGYHNLFGLAFTSALVNPGIHSDWVGSVWVTTTNPIIVNPGNATAQTNVSTFYSQTVDPSLAITNYYFALVNTPGTALPGQRSPLQAAPLPSNAGFASTNQTQIMIASVGTPAVIGGWAKEKILNGSADKFAYLGQYFVTNALVVTNGLITTNTTGVVSPYGDFFPMQPGQVAMMTMPDTDTGQQGTGVVDVISLNADANHDGVMDFTYNGPDFVSSGKPFRFWVNDNRDAFDDGGNFGVPGLLPPEADGWNYSDPYGWGSSFDGNGLPIYAVHGRRDLVDFFPIYLNIGSLFQSNALSAGISLSDTNYQFVLSQSDGVLRFVYTDLTPTNYMNFIQDTNESGTLSHAITTTITQSGVALTNIFLNGIATNNEGIIIVEAASATTQPLMLTIYHGTNQIAQTSLPLSISGVEQMFRHKNLLLSMPQAMSDRLTDADVPNEPDTINANFVFLHGYNVKPDEARGVQADMFKRMYWAGSHAKFYGVTWEGADSKIRNILTPNYHTNVVNAFATAPMLANFIATLTNSGPVVAAAHSLGNMVTLSAISDWNAPINQYFMMDAAVPVEAIDAAATTNMMIYSSWLNYSNRLFAANWYQLFPTNDARSTLFWNNRLGNLHDVDIYNFYSSGEEVLRTSFDDPPPTVLGMLASQIGNNIWGGLPFGTFTWYWQEKGKGAGSQDGFLCSSHGGWGLSLSTNYYSYYFYQDGYVTNYMSFEDAANIPSAQLRTNAFFQMTSSNRPADVTLYTASGDTYAQTNRNRILADAIPAMSVVTGANPVSSFDDNHNKDMQSLFENGWSQYRTGGEAGNWHHSDFVQMADTFTYKLFNQFVTTGNLK